MRIIKKFIVASAAAIVFGPLAAFAAQPSASAASGEPTATDAKTQLNFCTRIDNTSSQLNTLLSKLSVDRGNVRTKMLQDLSTRKTQRAQQVQQIRTDFQTKLGADITKLGANAMTDDQKAAVAAFKTAVTNAQSTRKAAVDAALAAYETAAQQTITDRENKVKDAAATFQSAVQAAMTQAMTDCANGIPPATARQTMNSSIQTANQAFRAVVTALPDGTLVNLAKTRNQTIEAANQAFRDAVKAAAATLKAALGTAVPTPATGTSTNNSTSTGTSTGTPDTTQ